MEAPLSGWSVSVPMGKKAKQAPRRCKGKCGGQVLVTGIDLATGECSWCRSQAVTVPITVPDLPVTVPVTVPKGNVTVPVTVPQEVITVPVTVPKNRRWEQRHPEQTRVASAARSRRWRLTHQEDRRR